MWSMRSWSNHCLPCWAPSRAGEPRTSNTMAYTWLYGPRCPCSALCYRPTSRCGLDRLRQARDGLPNREPLCIAEGSTASRRHWHDRVRLYRLHRRAIALSEDFVRMDENIKASVVGPVPKKNKYGDINTDRILLIALGPSTRSNPRTKSVSCCAGSPKGLPNRTCGGYVASSLCYLLFFSQINMSTKMLLFTMGV